MASFEKIVEEVAALPGVVAAAVVNTIPMAASEFHWGISVEERPPADPGATEPVLFRVVTPGYFETLQIPLLAGRSFSRLDGRDSPRAVVCNRAFAERHFAGRDALGKQIKVGRYDAAGDWVEIVGVVADVRERGLAQVDPALYLPMPQWDRAYLSRMHLLVRSAPSAESPVRALRARVRAVDADAVLCWAQRLKRVFGIDVNTCVYCGGTVRIVASVEEPKTIRAILDHFEKHGALEPAHYRPAPRAPLAAAA